MINKRLDETIFFKNSQSNAQYGFRSSYFTVDAKFYCFDFFRVCMYRNKNVAVILGEFSKAFVFIDHDLLKNKLNSLNFSDSTSEMSFTKMPSKKIIEETELIFFSRKQSRSGHNKLCIL